MSVVRLNHAVLYVRDAAASTAFYTDVLGFQVVTRLPGAVFLRAGGSTNDHDLGLFEVGDARDSGAGRGSVGLYHLAWEIDTLRDLEDLAGRLDAAGALAGSSDHGTTKSLYGRDPDGLEFEICWLVPADLLHLAGGFGTRPLDLAAEITRFGADTAGGLGVSRPAPESSARGQVGPLG